MEKLLNKYCLSLIQPLNRREQTKMKITLHPYFYGELVRYYEMKEKGLDVLAGIHRSSSLDQELEEANITLNDIERAILNNEVEVRDNDTRPEVEVFN